MKDETIIVRVEAEKKRRLEEAARRRGDTLSSFVLRAAERAAREEEAKAAAGEPAWGRHAGVPAFFRACCREAASGGQRGYDRPGYELVRYVTGQTPEDVEGEEWAEELGKLAQLLLPNDSSYVLPDEEVAVVRRVFETYATGQKGLRQIAEELNTRGAPAPAGGLWNHQTVRRILRDEVYLGRTVWNRQQRGRFFGVVGLQVSEVKPGKKRRTSPAEQIRKDGTHDPIVTPEHFQRCAALLARNARERNPGTGDFPLSGIFRCGHCGSAMTGRNFKFTRCGKTVLYRRYECSGYMSSGKAKCHFGCVEAEALAVALFNKLLPPWLDENAEALREEIMRQDRQETDDGRLARAGELRKRVERLGAEIVRATGELVQTDSPKQTERLRGVIREKEKAQAAAEEELRALEGRGALRDPDADADAALAMLGRLRAARDSGGRREQKAVLHEAVTRIEVFFNRERRGERTRSTFAQAMFWVTPELWTALSAAVGSVNTGS